MGRFTASAGSIIGVVAGALVAVPGASLAVQGTSPGSPGAKVARCGPPRARTLATSLVARVYKSGGVAYGCSVRGLRSYPLEPGGQASPFVRFGPVAVAGEVAAYGLAFSGVDTVSAEVIVRRLTDGELLRRDRATTKPLGAEFFQSVDAVVVKADGAVAWIANAGSVIGGGSSDTEVNKDDRRGRLIQDGGPGTLLDSGLAIDRRSLRLHRSTVSWRDGATRRSARLS